MMRGSMRWAWAFLLAGVAMADELPAIHTVWNFGKPAESEQAFRDLVAKSKGEYRLEARTQVARALGLQRKFDEAHAVLDAVEKELAKEHTAARMRYLLERGRTFNSSKKKDEAKALFLEAWTYGNETGEEYLAVDAAHMVTFVVPPQEQLAWNEKAIALAEKSEDPRSKLWLGTLYNNTGWAYHELKEYEKARAQHQKYWDWCRERAPGSRNELIAKWSVAKQLRFLDQVDEALRMHRELAAVYEEKGEKDGFVQEEIGECLLLLGRADEAKPHFRRAHEILSAIPWMREDEAERLARLKELGGQ